LCSYAPKAICDAIYSSVSGAQYDVGLGQWTVPCATEIDMALQIGLVVHNTFKISPFADVNAVIFSGQVFPVHPLDVTPADLTNPSTCVGSFVPQTISVGAGELYVVVCPTLSFITDSRHSVTGLLATISSVPSIRSMTLETSIHRATWGTLISN